MLAVIARTTRAGLRGHAWQSLLAGLIVAAAAATLTLALNVGRERRRPVGPHPRRDRRRARDGRDRPVPRGAARPAARPARHRGADADGPGGHRHGADRAGRHPGPADRAALERRRRRPAAACEAGGSPPGRGRRWSSGRSRAACTSRPGTRCRWAAGRCASSAPPPQSERGPYPHWTPGLVWVQPATFAALRLPQVQTLRGSAPAGSGRGRRDRCARAHAARVARRRLDVHERPAGPHRRHALGGAGAGGVQPVRPDHRRPDPREHDRRAGARARQADRDLQGRRLHAAARRRHAAGRAARHRPGRRGRRCGDRDAGRRPSSWLAAPTSWPRRRRPRSIRWLPAGASCSRWRWSSCSRCCRRGGGPASVVRGSPAGSRACRPRPSRLALLAAGLRLPASVVVGVKDAFPAGRAPC